jgi:hypothetical protein
MAKPTTLQEKKAYQYHMFLDIDRIVYLPQGTDPFAYLEDYPNSRIIPVLTVTDGALASGIGLDPSEYPLYLKENNIVKKLVISGNNLSINDSQNNNLNPGFLSITGGHLIGPVYFQSNPTDPTQAATKDYVDAKNTSLSGTVISGYQSADISMSGVLKAYTDTRDGVISGAYISADAAVTAAYQAAIASYSGIAESRFVNVSGDTMTGSLTMSGSNLLAATAGTSNIGTSGTPFNNTYANNYYDDGTDPVTPNQLVNKQYLEDQLTSGTKQVFSYVFTAATNYYTSVNSSTLTAVGTLIFRGSDVVGIPTNIEAILGHSSTGVQFQLYDTTNSKIICSVTTTNSGPIKVDCGTISNIPTGEAIFEFRLRRTGSNGQGRIYALDVRV